MKNLFKILIFIIFIQFIAIKVYSQTASLSLETGTTFTLESSTSFDISGSITINEGGTITNKGTLKITGSTVTVSGTLDIEPNATLDLADATSLTVNSGGTFEAVGTSGNRATITSSDTGLADGYTFTVAAGGTINAQYYNFYYPDANGLKINGNNAITNLNYGNFDYPVDSNTAYLLNFNDYTYLTPQTITGCSFNKTGTYTNSPKNVLGGAGAGQHGVITFSSYTGTFAGTSNESDPNGLIAWAISITVSLFDTAISFAQNTSDDQIRLEIPNSSVETIEIKNFKFTFYNYDSANVVLSTAQAQALFSNLYVYYSADAVFDAGDTVVVTVPSASFNLVSGVQQFDTTNNDPNIIITPAEGTKKYFVVAKFASGAAGITTNAFKVSNNPATQISIKNADETLDATVSGAAKTSKIAKAAYWIYSISNPIYSSPVIRTIGGEVKVIFGSGDDITETDGKLYCLDLSTEALCTGFPYPSGATYTAGIRTPISDFADPQAGNVRYFYFGTENGKVYSVSQTGNIRAGWTTPTIGNGSAIRAGIGVRGYITSWGGGSCSCSPTPCSSDCIGIFAAGMAGAGDARVYAYTANSATNQWISDTSIGSLTITSSPSVANAQILIGSPDNNVYKIETPTGIVSPSQFDSLASISGTGTGKGIRYWIGNTGGNVYEISTAGMGQTWACPMGSAVEGTIFKHTQQEIIYFGTNAGTFYKMSSTGSCTPTWTYTLPSLPIGSYAIKSWPMTTGGTSGVVTYIYFTADDGYIYKLHDLGTSVQARANWPASVREGFSVMAERTFPMISGGRVVVTTPDGKVFCFKDD